MALKNTVAAERRLDLASLFCMIGRHGPAVALAVLAMVSVLAGFIIYRTLRGKRRKAAAGDGETSSAGDERDASAIHPSPENRSGESTDASDEGSSEVMEDADVIQGDLGVRHRPAAAAAAAAAAAQKKPPPHSPLNTQIPENKTTTWEEDAEEVTAEMLTEEASQSDMSTAAETVPEGAVDLQPDAADDADVEVMEEVQDGDGCLKEPESVHDEKVLKAECQDGEDVSDKKTRHKEENTQWSLNKQTPPVAEMGDRWQDNKTTLEINTDESPVLIQDILPPCVSYDNDEEFEEENPDSIEHRSYSEEAEKDDVETAEEEFVGQQVVAQQAEIWSTNLPSETATAMAAIQDSDWDEDEGLDGESIEKVADEDHLNEPTAVQSDTRSPHKEENDPTCDGEEEEMWTSDVIVVGSKNHDGSNVSAPVKVDDLSGVNTDVKAEISCTEDSPDLSLACQHQDKMAPSLDEDIDSTSHETENLPENHRSGRAAAEECDDPHVRSCYDQQSVHVIDREVSDMTSVAADPDAAENASVIDEEKSCPYPTSIDHMGNDEMRVNSDAALLMSEEISHPDMLSSSQDQEDSEAGATPVTTKDVSLPVCQTHWPCFEQKRDGVLSPGVGEESGISSLAVSPDPQDAGNEFGVTAGDTVLPVLDFDLQSEGQTEAQNSLFADDAALSVGNEDIAGMVFGHYSSCHSQSFHSERSDWTQYKYFAANEDMFGHDIEDGYHREMDQFAAQLAVSVTSYTDDMKTQTDMKAVIEVVEIKERAGMSIEKKGDTNEEEKEETYERTEISIMEATMDNNEWITESFPVLPWLNLLVQDHTKTNQPPTEEGSAVTDTSCTDVPPSTEVKQTSSLSLADENLENNKKVVAVQPMPQNVNVTFCIHYFTQLPYQTVAVTGNQQELGNWKGFIPLERAKDGHWATVVSLPAESHVEWKFVVLDRGEVCRWEECGNRHLDTGYGDDLLVHKCWGLI